MTDLHPTHSRRQVLRITPLAVLSCFTAQPRLNAQDKDQTTQAQSAKAGSAKASTAPKKPWAEISLHQYSVRPLLRARTLDRLEFAAFAAKTFGIQNVEYASEIYADKLGDDKFFQDLRKRSDEVGVSNRILLCRCKNAIDSPDATIRTKALDEYLSWADAAEILGCEYLRVAALTKGDRTEQIQHAAKGIAQLAARLKARKVTPLLENLFGHSNNADWVLAVMKAAKSPNLGLLADFGNYDGDVYHGIEKMLPHCKALCAKAHNFDAKGQETKVDLGRVVKMARKAKFTGCFGIEYVGKKTPALEGIALTQKLLESAIRAAA